MELQDIGEPECGAMEPVASGSTGITVELENRRLLEASGGAHLSIPSDISVRELRRPVRSNRMQLPRRFQEYIPSGPAPLPLPSVPSPLGGAGPLVGAAATMVPSSSSKPSSNLNLITRTSPNRFGLMREYIGALPAHDPDDEIPLKELVSLDSPGDSLSDSDAPLGTASENLTESLPGLDRSTVIAPYPNFSSYLLGNWYWNGARTKSMDDRNDLIKNVILHPDFDKEDLRGLNWTRIDKDLAGLGSNGPFRTDDSGWRTADVSIEVPLGKDTPPRPFTVSGLMYRPLEQIVRSVCESEVSARFHYHPFRLLWQPSMPFDTDAAPPPAQEVFGELYTSKTFRDADAALQRSPREPGCELPRAIVALMPWSDSTHLADFGTASLWPLYVQFGNQSKYTRAQPTAHACHHAAYIPKLPSEIEDFIHQHLKKEGIDQLLTHCRRELMQAVWRLLLSDDFVAACRHGIVVKCYDGVTRRLYIRVFTYSADYPEKVLLATVRDMGICPCPRCLIPKDMICELGTARDHEWRTTDARKDDTERQRAVLTARSYILKKGLGVNSTAVEAVLKSRSLVPTVNAFSERLAPDVLPNFHTLFVPDLMHEWELGVWKGLMTHIVRILHAAKGGAVREFNSRFRSIPPFGTDVIRTFSGNVADMKQFAAHNFEDTLQCFIPAIDRILDEPHNSIVLDVVFLSALLHGLHKLHMHTDSTTKISDTVLVEYGKALRRFNKVTCTAFATVDLPKEIAARVRRTARQMAKGKATVGTMQDTEVSRVSDEAVLQTASASQSTVSPPTQPSSSATLASRPARRREYSLNTYKLHSLGDYTQCFRTIGTQDSYTTKNGELEHRNAKQRFERTSKKDYTQQLAAIERREANLQHITHQLAQASSIGPGSSSKTLTPPITRHSAQASNAPDNTHPADLTRWDELESFPPSDHHHIAKSQRNHIYLPHHVHQNQADPAITDFIPKLETHLLTRLRRGYGDTTSQSTVRLYPEADRRMLVIENERIYAHQILRVNYTTYDVRRGQDLIHPSAQRADVMLLANEDPEAAESAASPFWYARVLGIYHANVRDLLHGPMAAPRRMEFCFVRWFGRDVDWEAGWANRRLEQVGFVPDTDPDAFGFIDPEDIIRGCHLIPAFAEGRTKELLGRSRLARPQGESEDWERYYVNRFADRDMLMRYVGGGIGHQLNGKPSGVFPQAQFFGHIVENEPRDSEGFSLPPSSASGGANGDVRRSDGLDVLAEGMAVGQRSNRERSLEVPLDHSNVGYASDSDAYSSDDSDFVP
ncbi:hypothetical protein C8Q79DRAFT_965394 [Trametes meyenii]|nr:hypothetical protein C8Q79DRAFT_965394 [Trametes meyenii]